MRKTLIFIASSLLAAQLSPLAALAQEATPTAAPAAETTPAPQRKGLKERLYQKKEEVKGRIQGGRERLKESVEKKRAQFEQLSPERQEALKKKLGEKKAIAIDRFFQNMVKKFTNAIGRFDEFADRIEKRLDEAQGRGKDVATVREQLVRARAKIAEAERALEDAKMKYAEAVKNPDFKAAFGKVREVIKGVAEKVKEAHRALADVVKSTKGLGGGSGRISPTPVVSPAATASPSPAAE